MRRSELILTLFLTVGLVAPASAAPRPQQSWGKPGVSFDDYRKDAIECGRVAYYADLSGSEHAQAFVRGTKRLESLDGLPLDMYDLARRYGQIEASVRPEFRMRQLHEGMQQVVDICLTQRGYSRFALTDDQRRRLGKLKKGSEQRQKFMHSLASDGDVLRSQQIAQG